MTKVEREEKCLGEINESTFYSNLIATMALRRIFRIKVLFGNVTWLVH